MRQEQAKKSTPKSTFYTVCYRNSDEISYLDHQADYIELHRH